MRPDRNMPAFAQGLGQPQKLHNPCFQTTLREMLAQIRELVRAPLSWAKFKKVPLDKQNDKEGTSGKRMVQLADPPSEQHGCY